MKRTIKSKSLAGRALTCLINSCPTPAAIVPAVITSSFRCIFLLFASFVACTKERQAVKKSLIHMSFVFVHVLSRLRYYIYLCVLFHFVVLILVDNLLPKSLISD